MPERRKENAVRLAVMLFPLNNKLADWSFGQRGACIQASTLTLALSLQGRGDFIAPASCSDYPPCPHRALQCSFIAAVAQVGCTLNEPQGSCNGNDTAMAALLVSDESGWL